MQSKVLFAVAAVIAGVKGLVVPTNDELMAFAKRESLPNVFSEFLATPLNRRAEATYECHYNCGMMIYAAQDCNGDSSCLCASGSEFNSYKDVCLDCGWCVYDDYYSFLTAALETCGYPTTPTGTTCAPSTTAAAQTTSSAAAETTSSAAAETTSSAAAETTSSAAAETTSSAAAETTSSAASETTSSAAAESTSAVNSTVVTVEASNGAIRATAPLLILAAPILALI